ncbi:3D domain-containing protein [Rubritalea spongiae]|uniref:3D domain-containing protein n=1 Tax=Rubritalea spongiae TaxID=430797 RepID=A0ABW5E2Q6_9BACT
MTSLLLKAGLGLIAGVAFTSCSMQSETYVHGKKVEKGMPHPPNPTLVHKGQQMSRKDKHGLPTYKVTEKVRHVRTTAYSHMEKEVGCHGLKSAAGCSLKYTGTVRSAAADWSVYPMGTKFKIKGLPYIYEVNDYGSALVGTNTVDLFKPNLSKMYKWGTRQVELTVVEWGSFEKSRQILKGRTRYSHCRKMYESIVRKMDSGQLAHLSKTSKVTM